MITAPRQPIVATTNLSKRLGTVQANDGIDLALFPGEIHALLGENGAGKTTLLNLLSGLYRPDVGTIAIDGQPVVLSSPASALEQGIGTVHQHFSLVPSLSITENVLLGASTGFRIDLAAESAKLLPLMSDLGLEVSPGTEIRHLSLGQRQRVELLKVLSRNSRVLLLDEPTSVLSHHEVEELFVVLRSLRSQGVAIVLVTHKLEEALAVSDRITVLRNGRVAGRIARTDERKSDLTDEIIALMFGGGPAGNESGFANAEPGSALLTVTNLLALGNRGEIALNGLSLELRRGEVFGLAGIDGNGQIELAEALAGQRPIESGSIVMADSDITNAGSNTARKVGIGYVTDDRLGEGTVPSLSVADNLVLKQITQAPFSKRFWLDRKAIENHAAELIDEFGIRTDSPDNQVATLSGGNVQRLLLARELTSNPLLLICNKPTYGLDVRTAQTILQMLRNHAAAGNCVLLISPELDELLETSDRIGVLYNGQIVATMPAANGDPVSLGRLMTSGMRSAAA